MKPSNVLVLPDCGGAAGWQAAWTERHGYTRVEQHDWIRPLRGDWLARLEDTVLTRDEPCVLLAQGLGCILAAAWSARSSHKYRVKAALLVAPADVEAPDARERLPTWSPIDLVALAFPSVVAASRDDAACSLERARLFAHAWGSYYLDAARGDADWPEGHALLEDMMKD